MRHPAELSRNPTYFSCFFFLVSAFWNEGIKDLIILKVAFVTETV